MTGYTYSAGGALRKADRDREHQGNGAEVDRAGTFPISMPLPTRTAKTDDRGPLVAGLACEALQRES